MRDSGWIANRLLEWRMACRRVNHLLVSEVPRKIGTAVACWRWSAMPQPSLSPTPEKQHARAAGLSYATDADAGIRRAAKGTGFSYRGPSGKVISDKDTL